MVRENRWQVIVGFLCGGLFGGAVVAILWHWSDSDRIHREAFNTGSHAGHADAEAFWDLAWKGDVEPAYALTAPAFQKAVTLDQFKEFCALLHQRRRLVLRRFPDEFEPNQWEQLVDFKVGQPIGGPAALKLTMVETPDGWRVRWIVLYPNAIQ